MLNNKEVVQEIIDIHLDIISENLATFSSVLIGFLLATFSVIISYSDKPFFQGWANSGHFMSWKILYVISTIANIIILIFSFLILWYPNLVFIVFPITGIAIFSTLMVEAPLLFVSEKIRKGTDNQVRF